MKKSDLKNGDLLVLKNGSSGLYHNGKFVSFGWDIELSDELKYIHNNDYDVYKVFKRVGYCDSIFDLDMKNHKLIWERVKTPEYTMKELIEKLGHDFKIKK